MGHFVVCNLLVGHFVVCNFLVLHKVSFLVINCSSVSVSFALPYAR